MQTLKPTEPFPPRLAFGVHHSDRTLSRTAPSLVPAGILTGLIMCKSCACSTAALSSCAAVLLSPENTVLLRADVHYLRLIQSFLSLLQWSLSLERRECGIYVPVRA